MLLDPIPHLVIPFAACNANGWLSAVSAMPQSSLTNLGRLLKDMKLMDTDCQDADTLSPPHERAQARALGLVKHETPDGLIPWAAIDAVQHLPTGQHQAWAWITPCHWSMGNRHATLVDPAALHLQPGESQALLAIMQPYFETDSITLHYVPALGSGRWLAEGDVFRDMPTASLDRVLGQDVDNWLPSSRQQKRSAGLTESTESTKVTGSDELTDSTIPMAQQTIANDATSACVKVLSRLQNEMQMLLYTHSFNDERQLRRQLPVNSFWISGTGALMAQFRETSTPPLFQQKTEQVKAPRDLVQAVFREDWASYTQAWSTLDSGDIAALLARQQRGETVRLSLCGESSAQTFETHRAGLLRNLSSLLRPLRILDMFKQL